MNILLWSIQVPLAVLYLAGGSYKAFAFEALAKQMTALPHAGWRTIGMIEMAGGLLLLAPAAIKRLRPIVPLTAWCLTLESLVLSGIYASYSTALAATNPLVWSAAMALLTALIGWGRLSTTPRG